MKPVTVLFSIVFFSLTSYTTAFAQRTCSTMEYLELQKQKNRGMAEEMLLIEQQTQKFTLSKNANRSAVIITIPVVVHVVYNNASQNISDAQIQSQIDVLNEDFRRMNADASSTPLEFQSVASDIEIEFCMATIDPFGAATNGITRTSTTETAFTTGDFVKFSNTGGKDAWPKTEYLNFWVCNVSGNTLGYAQFPGGPSNTDGVVIDYQYMGTIGTATSPFDLGRTATHEVGHYLNLRHIWGDGDCQDDDFVADTPNAGDPNYTSSPCTFPGPNSCNGPNDQDDMFQNYMDYSDDACMNLFTTGQKTRIRSLFEPGGFRESLAMSNGCGTPLPPTCGDGYLNNAELRVDCGGANCMPCPPCTQITINITLDNYPGETSWRIDDVNGNEIFTGGTFVGATNGSTISETACVEDGCYAIVIVDAFGDGICCGEGNGSYKIINEDGDILASGGVFTSSDATNFCEEKKYVFEGPGSDWSNPTLWDRNLVPPIGYDGTIVINADCVKNGPVSIGVSGVLQVNPGFKLTQN